MKIRESQISNRFFHFPPNLTSHKQERKNTRQWEILACQFQASPISHPSDMPMTNRIYAAEYRYCGLI
jgi:hypothetical protein